MTNLISNPLVRLVFSIILFVICLASCGEIFLHALELKIQGESYIIPVLISGMAFVGGCISLCLIVKEYNRFNEDISASLEADLKEYYETRSMNSKREEAP